jgi:transcriptional regulator with GAF, ATPase, and Fis domain
MTKTSNDYELFETFATLADTLVVGYDVVDLLQTLVESCGRLLDVEAAGILLADSTGQLDLIASSSEAARLVELMQLSAEAGPCIESYITGAVVSVPDIAEVPDDWRLFQQEALAQGFASIYAIPLRLRETTIGALNLLSTTSGELGERDVRVAQAFADVATIGILHERAIAESSIVREQLSQALQSRIIIEQAKGVISHRRSTTTDEAFVIMRTYARSNRMRLSDVAQRVVNRELNI